jgi:hypothetical protein
MHGYFTFAVCWILAPARGGSVRIENGFGEAHRYIAMLLCGMAHPVSTHLSSIAPWPPPFVLETVVSTHLLFCGGGGGGAMDGVGAWRRQAQSSTSAHGPGGGYLDASQIDRITIC